MPMPQEYQIAAQRFEAFLADAGDALGLATRNQTYTVVEAVLLTFRRRLTAEQVLVFADGLPPMLRAIFVAGWRAGEPPADFADRAAMEREVRALRRNHNFAPEGSIAKVAGSFFRHVDTVRFDKALAGLSPEAKAFWEA